MLTLMCLVDRLMYCSWIFVPLNFLKFNFLSSGGDYYGTHKWHWYFTQGFPVMLFSFLPFSIAGIVLSKQWKPSGLIVWVLVLYSVLGHKEFRLFLFQFQPFVLLFLEDHFLHLVLLNGFKQSLIRPRITGLSSLSFR